VNPVADAQLGLDAGHVGFHRAQRDEQLGGELAGTRSVEITRAFVDLRLRGTPEPLLERPSTRYPEVGFRSPEQEKGPS
jgi:hypothetical protein